MDGGIVMKLGRLAIALVVLFVYSGLSANSDHGITFKGSRVFIDGFRGEVLYRSSGDLDGDGKREVVESVCVYRSFPSFKGIIVSRKNRSKRVIVAEDIGLWGIRSDVTDINGDGRLEIVVRGLSGDGHWQCSIYVLKAAQLVRIADFDDTRFRDLDGDGTPEVLSKSMISFGFIGDHWLTIYKWNGRGYTDVSLRFPNQYDAVIRDLRQVIYETRYTTAYGTKHSPASDPEIFADLYYYLGKAYEYRRLPGKARMPYAIAYRLNPENEEIAGEFRRMWDKG